MSLFMDEYSGKKAGDRLGVPRKSSNLILRDTANNREPNAQFCNRLGCNGRMSSAKFTQITRSEKAKSLRPSFRSSSIEKGVIGSSSATSSATHNPWKSLLRPRKKLPEGDSCETGASSDDAHVPELVQSDDSGSSENTPKEAGSSSLLRTRSHRSFNKKLGSGKPNSSIESHVSSVSKTTSQATGARASKYGIRNVRWSSTSDVPTRSSTPCSSLTRQKGTTKERNCEASARGRKISGPSLSVRNSSSISDISISDSRKTRNGTSSRNNGLASIRSQRSPGYSRSRTATRGDEDNLSPNEPNVIPQLSQLTMPRDSNSPRSSDQSSVDSSSRMRAHALPGGTRESLHGIRSSSPAEVGNIGSSVNRHSFRRYNMDGIAEVLLALERIEQDEELSYEQLLVLETNLFLNGLNFYDQHRDMRLDIDNMSYEELLALEERIGTVSTALSEDALSECLKTSIFQPASSDLCGERADVKCSICQEEYINGEEVGSLQCEHKYHAVCIQQWLRLKNWCPICKASAVLSSSEQ